MADAKKWDRALDVRAGRGNEAVDPVALHMLFYVHSAGSLQMLFDTEGGAQERRFVGGSQAVPITLAERLVEQTVVKQAPVRRIEHGPEGVVAHADGGVTVRARRAVVALAGRIVYDPPLPGYRDQLTQRVPLGTVAKCMAIYDEPFWRGGPERSGHERPRPDQADLRQLAPRRLTRRAARLSRGPRGAPGRAAVRPRATGDGR